MGGSAIERGVSAPRGVPASGPGGGVGVVYPSMQCGRPPPPLCEEFLPHATENTTSPQTSFAGGKKCMVQLN